MVIGDRPAYRADMRLPWLVPLTLVAVLTATTLPAEAASRTWKDAGGGRGSGLDIRAVKVVNTAKGVRVTFRVPKATNEAYPVGDAVLDIDVGRSKGPEFRMTGSVPGGTEFRSLKGSRAVKRSWRQAEGLRYGRCAKTVRQNWSLDRGRVALLITPKKGCLYRPKKVRVKLRTYGTGTYDYSSGVLTEFPATITDRFPQRGFSTKVRYSKR